MRSRASLAGLALVGTLLAPATAQAQANAQPETHYVTVTTFSAPFDEEGQKVMWWIDSVMVPVARVNPNVLHMRVGNHIWGSSAGDIVLIQEFASWSAINTDCDACAEWFQQRQPAEGTPERAVWDEAQATFLKYYHGHHDEIYASQVRRSK